jgi:hypothetical protein
MLAHIYIYLCMCVFVCVGMQCVYVDVYIVVLRTVQGMLICKVIISALRILVVFRGQFSGLNTLFHVFVRLTSLFCSV